MLTYNISQIKGPVYKGLYELIKQDIKSGALKADEKMPSKRTFARNLGISTICIENTYDLLISEGYLYAVPKKGYFVSQIPDVIKITNKEHKELHIKMSEVKNDIIFDFSSNQTDVSGFPFSVWAKVIRESISQKEKELLTMSPSGGVRDLRQSIAHHLQSFRGMSVSADQIIVGAGTEYLYSLIIKLLGKDKVYCIENPGYNKLSKIYASNDAVCIPCNMDDSGIITDEIRKACGDIVHVSPTHHFPTGITMSVNRRYELLSWVNEKEGRYIIEDDYDSEFRLNGKPLPTLQSLDGSGKIIYMNTFSKSLTSTIRISYMVLPEELANAFYEKLGFYSCTVSTFEQYALASFINQGYFEKHINRMRLYYGKKRECVIEKIKNAFNKDECRIIENDSGLHFILEIHTTFTDSEVKQRLLDKKIKISSVSDYYLTENKGDEHRFIVNYSSMDINKMDEALAVLRQCTL